MGTLYVVDVPLGNPEDVTLRALRALREASLVVAQDIPRVREFLTRYGIDTPLASDSESRDIEEIALEALESGDVALLSETTPFVYGLVCTAVERGLTVASVPGPSAAVTALVLSGLPADAFVCLGVLPRRAAGRRALLASLAAEPRTMVAFEMSSHLPAALRDMAEALGDRPMALTQVEGRGKEGVWRGTVREALAHFEANLPDGQCALVIGGATEDRRWPEARVRSELARLVAAGLSRKAAARQVARVSGWRQREVYRLAGERMAQDCGA
jgi:16S rRNA (cytidine1402-2'-O)-methyltransferase